MRVLPSKMVAPFCTPGCDVGRYRCDENHHPNRCPKVTGVFSHAKGLFEKSIVCKLAEVRQALGGGFSASRNRQNPLARRMQREKAATRNPGRSRRVCLPSPPNLPQGEAA